MANNKYGLDARYFKEKLGQLVRDADSYTPDEMQRALGVLRDVAISQKVTMAIGREAYPLADLPARARVDEHFLRKG